MKLSFTQIIVNVFFGSTMMPLVVGAKGMEHPEMLVADANGAVMKHQDAKEEADGAVFVSQMGQKPSSSSSLLRGATSARGLSSTTTYPTDSDKGYLLSFHSNEDRAFMIVDDSVSTSFPVIRQATTLDQFHSDYAFWTHETLNVNSNNIFLVKNSGTGTCLEIDENASYQVHGFGYHV